MEQANELVMSHVEKRRAEVTLGREGYGPAEAREGVVYGRVTARWREKAWRRTWDDV